MHFRTAGSGPPVLLIHQSPQHSGAWRNLILRLEDRYTLIAPDTPGFGYSDLVPEATPSIADLAAATLALCDCLGLDRFVVIGTHTGAAIAAELAIQNPDRIAHLFLDGYPLFHPEERQHILSGYFPANSPRWDGGHLIWAWQRLREQLLFFPWFDSRPETRMDWPIPEAQGLQSQLLELMLAGENYKVGYRAAFEDNAFVRPASQSVPVAYLYRTTDILAPHAERLSDLPDNARIDLVEGAVSDMEAHIDSCLAELPPWPDVTLPDALQSDAPAQFVICESGDLAVTYRGDSRATQTVVVIHDIGQSSACLQPWFCDVPADTDLCFVDLPGHGMSNEFEIGDFRMRTIAHIVLQALENIGITHFDLVVKGGATALSTVLVSEADSRGLAAGRVLLWDPLLLDSAELSRYTAACTMPELDPSGAHLLKTWMRVRDSRLVWPWFDAAGDRFRGPGMDPELLQAEWLALWLTQPNHNRIIGDWFGEDWMRCDYGMLPAETQVLLSAAPELASRQRRLAETLHYECFSNELPTESQLRHWLR